MVWPSQVTWPGSDGQLALTAMQLAALTLLEQETVVPYSQVAVALQRDFPGRITGRLAT
jgi:hypothetical protein